MTARIAGLAALAAALWPGLASAHAFGARYDLPLPLGLYLGAAGLAVAASFGGAVVFLRRGAARAVSLEIAVPAALARGARTALALAGVAVLALVLAAAALGAPEATRNLATVTVWVLWWVGFLLFSALVVGLWPWLDPFRTLSALAARAFGRAPGARPVPRAAGYLAPAGLLAIAWVELVSDWSEDPRALGALILLYLAVALAGGLAYGRDWFATADPLGRVFELVGRLAPIAFAPGRLRLRPPGEGLVEPGPDRAGETALVIVLIGIVLFDGLSETPAWAGVLDFVAGSETLRPALLDLRAAGVDLLKLLRSIGLFSAIAAFWLTYLLLVRAMRAMVATECSTARLAHDFAGTLLPIAIAYHLAHYVSYLMIAGQLAIPAASDPFAMGWDLFGGRGRSIDITVIGARHVWWIAFAALIAGHGLSVLTGHRRAIHVFGEARAALRSQIPMMVAMVGLTMLSLWILAQPIVA